MLPEPALRQALHAMRFQTRLAEAIDERSVFGLRLFFFSVVLLGDVAAVSGTHMPGINTMKPSKRDRANSVAVGVGLHNQVSATGAGGLH